METMDFQFFESLSHAEAVVFLNNFLNTERKAVEEMIVGARSEGVHADFTVASVPPVLKWVVGKLTTVPLIPDETLPSSIRETDTYSSSLFDFDEPSRVVISRAAYYLGQSFINYSALLSWSVGDSRRIGKPKTVHQNMPVVTGFTFDLELAPIWVVENLSRRIIRQAAGNEAIDRAVEYWLGKVPDRIQ
jgi:hypothetical protein